MTRPRFDPLIHPATRLSLVALLAAAEWVEFAYARETLGLSDSALSKQLSGLEEAGYLEVRKEGRGRHRRTIVRLSRQGRAAFDGHVAALEEMLNPSPAAEGGERRPPFRQAPPWHPLDPRAV